MNIWSISIQNIKSKPLYTFLSVFILSLSIALLLGIQQLKKSLKSQIENNLGHIDLVIGAKGSPLQLVLASILHIDNPTGNIAYAEAQKIANSPMVKQAVPISYGDNYKSFRIVGTTNEFSSLYNAELKDGRIVKKSMEVVLGSTVAQRLNLKIGDHILSSHGLLENSIDVHSDELTIVGILKPTQKIIDQLILTNLQSVWDVHNHETNHNHEHKHEEEEKEITSLLINFKSPRALLSLPRKINKQTKMQAALPRYQLDRLYEYTGVGFKAVAGFAYLILIIAGTILFTSLYKMVKERAFDLAILRTYGSTNFQLVSIVAIEGLSIGLSSFVLGFMFIKVGLNLIFKMTMSGSNFYILKELSLEEILHTGISVFILIIVSIAFAIYPILKMDISTILSNEK